MTYKYDSNVTCDYNILDGEIVFSTGAVDNTNTLCIRSSLNNLDLNTIKNLTIYGVSDKNYMFHGLSTLDPVIAVAGCVALLNTGKDTIHAGQQVFAYVDDSQNYYNMDIPEDNHSKNKKVYAIRGFDIRGLYNRIGLAITNTYLRLHDTMGLSPEDLIRDVLLDKEVQDLQNEKFIGVALETFEIGRKGRVLLKIRDF